MNVKAIAGYPSGLYTAVVDGKDAIIAVDHGKGFTIRTMSKPGWYVIHEYDRDGDCVGEIYERDK